MWLCISPQLKIMSVKAHKARQTNKDISFRECIWKANTKQHMYILLYINIMVNLYINLPAEQSEEACKESDSEYHNK